MTRKPILVGMIVLAIVTMACGVNIKIPFTRVKTGPTVTQDIVVPALSDPDEVANLSLQFGAGDLTLSPGAEKDLVSGVARFNVPDIKPEVEIDGEDILVTQGNLKLDGIPSFREEIVNEWDLTLGLSPLNLKLSAGAYKGIFELGGLDLRGLEVMDGASDVRLSFSTPNRGEMGTFRYQTGASDVRLTDLANANFETLIFNSGAGTYSLDFSGKLKRDATVSIDSGVSTVTIIVPAGVSAKVTFTGGLSSVDYEGEWEKKGDEYRQPGSGPTITIIVDMGAGTLELRNK